MITHLDIDINLLDVGGNVGSGAAALLTWLIVAIYGTFSNWRLTHAGRAFMALSIALGALLTKNTVHLFVGAYPGRWVVQIVFALGLCIALFWMLWTILRILIQGDPITSKTFIEKKAQDGKPS